ncbi:MAG TPA: DUF3971 domain-containing protein, partial [Pseudomonadales bacterium]|nr:DUF3971 domain-containing protein [Pseudomonadales bacterium]
MPFRFASRLIVNLLQGTVLAILIAAACYVSVGRILVSNANKFRAKIEKTLTDTLNVDVHIGKIDGNWIYLDPRISISDLVIGDKEHPAIDIGHISARLDSVASLRERTIVVRKLDIQGLVLTVRKTAAGWGIQGIPRRQGSSEPFNTDPIMDSIRYMQEMDIRDVDVRVDARNRSYLITNQSNKPLKLAEEGAEKTLDMPLSISRQGGASASEFELLGRYSGDPRMLSSFSANLYLRLPQIELADFLPPINDRGLKVSEAGLRGQVWIDCRHGEFSIRGLPVIDHLAISRDDKNIGLLKNFSARLAATSWASGEWQFHFGDLSMDIAGTPWKIPGIDFLLKPGSDGMSWGASLDSLDIGQAVHSLVELGRSADMLDEDSIGAIRSIAPGGTLKDIVVRGGQKPSDLTVAARIDGAHIEPWHGIPGVSTISGLAVLSPDHGYIDVDNKQFILNFKSMFPEPWNLDSARARIDYERSPGYLRISSGLMDLSSGGMTAAGKLRLNLPADLEKRTWGLEIGIRNTKLLDVHKYLPETMSEDLTAWLNRSIKGGYVAESGLVFHGTLGKDTPKISKLYELYFKIDDGILDYDPAWPPVDNLRASVYIGDWGVASDDAQGKIYSSNVTNGHVSLTSTE